MDGAGEAPEKGAVVRVVPDGAGIPAESLRQQRSNSNRPSQPKEKELLAGASGKNENDSVVLDDHESSDSLDQDIEKGNYVDNAQAMASFKGRSDEDMQRINRILVPGLEVQSSQQQSGSQPGNSNYPQPPKGKELLVGGAAVAGVGDKSENVSRVVQDQASLHVILDLDIEKTKVINVKESTPGKDVEAGPRYPFQLSDNDDDSLCRICHMNSGMGEVVNLGCACKLDLGLAHKRCADTWFAFRGNWECEICGETARNVKPLELMERDRPDVVATAEIRYREFARYVCIRLLVICLLWVGVVFLVIKVLVPAFRKAADKENQGSGIS